MGKKSRSVSGMNIPDHISESLETIFWVKIPVPVLKFFDADADPDPGSGNLLTLDLKIILTLDPGIFLTLDTGSGIG
jgi:hypothetical protein